ncbi:hypothetical protein KOR42_08250 [Thalassoglobus neptunius]|uniref:Uncharacterized protein n=1 Tax=Thalassoglobus neptunius TaxID=1938619 RepID=A0A5C5X2X2_9PLAN|nr:hypothetical protein [Thalassoglobus neptunius]TWT57464.1 hypothetical protein KOR42_08250 [Thalassoglobus neptunius]
MNKKNLATTSLIAAIPAGILLFFALKAVLGSFDKLPTVLMVAMILLLVVAGVMLLFPGYILIYYSGTKRQKAGAEAPVSETGAVPAAVEEDQLDAAFTDEEGDEFADDEFGDEFEFDEEDED